MMDQVTGKVLRTVILVVVGMGMGRLFVFVKRERTMEKEIKV